MAVSEANMGKNRKKEYWLGGKLFVGVTDASEQMNENERSYPVYGLDNNLKDRVGEDGTLTLRVLTAEGDMELQHMLNGRNPDSMVTPLYVNPNNANILPVWCNRRSPDNAEYLKGTYYGDWAPLNNGGETGGPDDPSQPEFTGPCSVPIHINNGFIYGEKVAMVSGSSGWTGTTTNTPVLANDTTEYALDIFLISGTGNGPLKFYKLSRGGSLINASGVITIAGDDAGEIPSAWGGITSAFPVLVGTGTGTWKKNNIPNTYHNFWS